MRAIVGFAHSALPPPGVAHHGAVAVLLTRGRESVYSVKWNSRSVPIPARPGIGTFYRFNLLADRNAQEMLAFRGLALIRIVPGW